MREKRTKLTDLLAILVFVAFTLCVLLVLLFGAKVYRGLVGRGEESFRARTAAQYVTTRVHQAERVSVADFEGCQALVIPEEIDGAIYLTRVYCYDGYIRELFSGENAALSPEDGEKILPGASLIFSIEDNLLIVRLEEQEISLYLRGKEASP